MKLREKLKHLALDILFDVLGGTLFAAGIYSFASPANFVSGGVTGLGMIINHYTQLPIGLCTLALNIPIILLCVKTMGRRFLFRSLRTMVISTLILDVVFPLMPVYSGDKLMAALFAGALTGAGLGLIYWRGSSTGGSDFLILTLQKKLPHLSIGNITGVIDGSIIAISGLVFRQIDAVLQGFVMMVVSTVIIDKITAGFMRGQLTLIVTEKGGEIAEAIMQEVGRGVTAVDGTGMFSGSGKKILVCACSRAEACRIRGMAYGIDRAALVVLCPYDTAYGLGFQPPDV